MTSKKGFLVTLGMIAVGLATSMAPIPATAQSASELCSLIESLPNLAAFNGNPAARAAANNPASPCYAIAQAKLQVLRTEAAAIAAVAAGTGNSNTAGSGYSGL